MNLFKKEKGKTKLKIPTTDKAGMWFLKYVIPSLPKEKLYGVKGVLESYDDSEIRTELLLLVKKTFEKRGYDYLDLKNNDNLGQNDK